MKLDETKSVLWEAICRRVGKTKIVVVFPNSGNASENSIVCFVLVWNVILYFNGTVNIASFAQQSDTENR
jgi:hypothetical protein